MIAVIKENDLSTANCYLAMTVTGAFGIVARYK